MFLILVHHFSQFYYYESEPFGPKVIFLKLFGMWGKTAIDCFLMITGYFMCKSEITVRKFLKLILEVYFYKLVIYVLLLFGGYETVSAEQLVKLIFPIWDIEHNFVDCFICFWLTIPFWNILIKNMTKRQHQLLLILLLCIYTLFGTIPGFHISYNYVTWFGVVYLMASYVRYYTSECFNNKRFWGWMTLASVTLSVLSVFIWKAVFGSFSHYMLAGSHKILAVTTAFASFLWFKNMDIKFSKFINIVGGSTFAVILIHSNSEAMRTWLWKNFIDCKGHYSLPCLDLILYTVGVSIAIFAVCIIIDRIRIRTLEEPFFKWYDRKYARN